VYCLQKATQKYGADGLDSIYSSLLVVILQPSERLIAGLVTPTDQFVASKSVQTNKMTSLAKDQ
jgi:hypothetical protein